MEPESHSILSFLNEDPGLLPIFASISAYLSEDQLFALRTSKGLIERTKIINQQPLYWKERVENWFGILLHDHKVNWKRIYLSLIKEEEELKIARLRKDIYGIKKTEKLRARYFKSLDNISPLLIAEESAAINDDVELIKVILDVLRNETDEQIATEVNYIVERALFEVRFNNKPVWNVINFLIDMVTDVSLKTRIFDTSIQWREEFKITEKLFGDPQLKSIIDYDDAFHAAIVFGNVIITKLLLDGYPVHPEAHDNAYIIDAATNGYEGIVKLLMNDTRVDPTAGNNRAIKRAVERNKWNIVRVLFNDERVRESLNDPDLVEKIKETLFIE
jgi:hypothetical protein